MKTLMLLRHAKSSWTDDSLVDHDRGLNRRGERDAPRIGAYLRDQGLLPDSVLCSTATRAWRTWKHVAAALNDAVPVERLEELYNARPGITLEVIRRRPAEDRVTLVVGHNSGLQELAVSLAGSGDSEALARMARKFPTGGLAVLRFQGDTWAAVARSQGELDRFIRPKDLSIPTASRPARTS